MPDPKALTPMFNALEEPFPMIEDRDGRLVAAVKDYAYAKKSAQMLNDILDTAVAAERERVLAEIDEAAESVFRMEYTAVERHFYTTLSRQILAELRKWVSDNGALHYGKDREIALELQETRKVNWETLAPAIQRSIELGEPFDKDDHINVTTSTRTADRKSEKPSPDHRIKTKEAAA